MQKFKSPTFEEFNKRTTVDAPYVWENRMYLNPVFYNKYTKIRKWYKHPDINYFLFIHNNIEYI